MTDKEKELYMKYCKYDREPKEIILDLLEQLESLKDFKEIAENKVTDLNPIGLARANQLLSRQCHNLQAEIEKKDKIIDKYIAYIWKYDLNESKEWIKNYIENEWEVK